MPKQRFGNELHPLYGTWLSMTQRCRNPKHSSYKHYGAKGITVEDYLQSFKHFVKYMENLPRYNERVKCKLTMDRIDSKLGYTRGNLQWADKTNQTINSKQRYNSKSKYVGVGLNTTKRAWNARLTSYGTNVFIGSYPTEEEALAARNAFILEHNLPHKIQKQIK